MKGKRVIVYWENGFWWYKDTYEGGAMQWTTGDSSEIVVDRSLEPIEVSRIVRKELNFSTEYLKVLYPTERYGYKVRAMKTVYYWPDGQWAYKEELNLIPQVELDKFKSFDVQDDISVEQIGKMVKTAYMLLQSSGTNKERFVWFSQNQKESHVDNYNILNSLGERRIMAKLQSGEIVEYTEMTVEPKPYGSYNDYIYVGIGNYHKAEYT